MVMRASLRARSRDELASVSQTAATLGRRQNVRHAQARRPPAASSIPPIGSHVPGVSAPVAACRCASSLARPLPAGDGVARIRREVGGRGGKTVTVVTGLALDPVALAALSKRLKSACGTGGTVKSGALEFQGDHREQLASLLASEGFRCKFAGG